ncbi:hypothetical protein EG936_21150, partial [Salmonella enterica]|nr:hypothetical protein [Salmonella enterica]
GDGFFRCYCICPVSINFLHFVILLADNFYSVYKNIIIYHFLLKIIASVACLRMRSGFVTSPGAHGCIAFYSIFYKLE